ncbi:ABC transporter permease subunit [Phytoactinopolyspora halophila]|uniref:ABC transporter permease subunit n=1 Tax=Phytoactinopolyspora halophila TaxID=1981511 RepID=UPI001314CCBE|nr:ABC transporter permease subunit [Phytoactinopolyspora halophila]
MPQLDRRRVRVVLQRDLRDYRSWSSFKIAVLLFAVITVVATVGTFSFVRGGADAAAGDDDVARQALGIVLFLLAMLPVMVGIPLFSTESLTREKSSGTMASLLATPLTPREICLGKSSAIFLPLLGVTVLAPIVAGVAINLFAIQPVLGEFFFPPSLILTVVVVVPLFFFGLANLTIELSMAGSAELAVAPSYLVGLALLVGVPISTVLGVADPASWSFLLVGLLATAVMWLVVWVASRWLSEERIVLS